jgi:hypothetical protein
MIPPRTNKPGLEVITSPIHAPKQATNAASSPLGVVSPGRVRRLAGITPNKTGTGRFWKGGASSVNDQDNENKSSHFNGGVLRSNSSMTSVKDRYGGIHSKPSSPRIGIQHGSNNNSAFNKTAPNALNNNLNNGRATNYLNAVKAPLSSLKKNPSFKSNKNAPSQQQPSNNNTSNNMPPLKSSSYDNIPSLMTESETFDTCDESTIVETALYHKFKEAFELTLKSHPGILPGAPSVVDSVQNALYKLTQSKVEKEEGLRAKIAQVKKEKEEMEAKLSAEMGSLALERNELTRQLEKLTNEKQVSEESLKRQLAAVSAMKSEISAKLDEATLEKEELTKHLGHLSKSRIELESALETEMKLVEKDRDELERVLSERKALQRQKMENKELESKIEIMTESATKEKATLQAEAAELKNFEAHLAKLKESNEETRKELEEEKRQLLEITRTLQTKKQAVIESREEIERGMMKEIEELEASIENCRLMHSKDMEMLVKSKVVKYLKRKDDDDSVDEEGEEKDMESLIESRVEAKLKAKDIELKERELALKEMEMKERREQEEEERRVREKELEQKLLREVEARERELEEKFMREREKWAREREMKERKEETEREAKEKEVKKREEKLEAARKKRAGRNHYHYSDDEDTVDDSTVHSKIRRSRSSRSRVRRNKSCDDDESTIASVDRRKCSSKKEEVKTTAKKAELQKELEELRKEISKNKNESNEPREIDELLKHRRETTGIMTSMRKYFSHEADLRGEIASLREEIKMNHRESSALRHGGRGYHESPGVASYSAPARDYHESPGMASYASAPARESHYEPERRSNMRRRYDDDEDVYLDNQPMNRAPIARRGYGDDHEYDREPRFRSSSRFSSPGVGRFSSPGRTTRSPRPRNSTSGIAKSKYYM